VLPLTYFVQISGGVMLKAAPTSALAEPIVLLAVLAIAVLALAVVRFRRELGPSRTPHGASRGMGWGLEEVRVRRGRVWQARTVTKDATPTIVDDELELIRQIAPSRSDWLKTPERRHRLLLQLLRQLPLLDVQTIPGSPGWRTLHATFMGLADGALRDQVQTALARSEQATTALGLVEFLDDAVSHP
jgi:hypothetical protein